MHGKDTATILSEMKMVIQLQYAKRMEVLCQFVDEVLKVPLHSKEFLDNRGSTLLHSAMAQDSIDVAKILIRHGTRELIMAEMTGTQFAGMTALHSAIVNCQVEIFDEMMNKLKPEDQQKLVNTQTQGTFFGDNVKASNVPISLALWCGKRELYDKLVDFGAEADAKDNLTGNTALHTLVLYSKKDCELVNNMIDHMLNSESTRLWWCKKQNIPNALEKFSPHHWKHLKYYLLNIENCEGYSPLTLAARSGTPEVLTHLYIIKQVIIYNVIYNVIIFLGYQHRSI